MEPGESVEGLVMATGADSILFMDFIKLLDQEPLRSGLPEVAKGEVPQPYLSCFRLKAADSSSHPTDS